MHFEKSFPFRRFGFTGFVILSLTFPAFALQQSKSPTVIHQERPPLPPIFLEINSPQKSVPIYRGYGGMFLLRRELLPIINAESAKDITAVDVWAIWENEVLKVRLSIIYNDLSNSEWWKDKKEKELGNFIIPIGNSLSPVELLQFGIEPFEIKVVSNKLRLLKPEEYPRIVNRASSMEIGKAEKSLDYYCFVFKNNSNKDVIAIELSSGGYASGEGSSGRSREDSLIPSGEAYEKAFYVSDIEKHGLTIEMILFSDGTFEGDAKLAARYIVGREGRKMQAGKLLLLVEQAINVSDDVLAKALDKLEAQLQQMQEAMDKPSAIEYLKMKYPAFDEKTINRLYEEFKRSFYDARTYALSPIHDYRRRTQERSAGLSNVDKTALLREGLNQAIRFLKRIE
jgi:hypothetical protein